MNVTQTNFHLFFTTYLSQKVEAAFFLKIGAFSNMKKTETHKLENILSQLYSSKKLLIA